jgi:hypothetical protein
LCKIPPYSSVIVHRRFGETYCLHLQIEERTNQAESVCFNSHPIHMACSILSVVNCHILYWWFLSILCCFLCFLTLFFLLCLFLLLSPFLFICQFSYSLSVRELLKHIRTLRMASE